MKNIVLCISIWFCLACSNKSEPVQQFEREVGPVMTQALDESVNAFERMLAMYYQSDMHTDLYTRFLKDVSGEALDWNKFYSEKTGFSALKTKLSYNGMYEEFVLLPGDFTEYITEDFIDVDDDFVHREYYYWPKGEDKPVDTIIVGTRKQNYDGPYSHVVKYNKMIQALSQVETKSVETYVDVKLAAGRIMYELTANGLLHNEVDVNNYFVQRIVAYEFLIQPACDALFADKEKS